MQSGYNTTFFNRNNFYKLLQNDIKIEIPIYQRDFAYGRNKDEITRVRREFIEDIYKALFDNEELDLDIIYGGSQIKEGKKYIPVDGQQRLTVLFLFHWYVFTIEYLTKNKLKVGDTSINEENYLSSMKVLKNFDYYTRFTTRDFCENLIGFQLDLENIRIEKKDFKKMLKDKYLLENRRFYEEINKTTWFTRKIYSDPNVKSMIVVLDEIHIKMCQLIYDELNDELRNSLKSGTIDEKTYPIKLAGLYKDKYLLKLQEKSEYLSEKLKNDSNISFFENLEVGIGDSDSVLDLYIKMNGRGVILTDFETFKSRLKNLDVFTNTIKDQKEAMGKLNTEYANTFFEILDGGVLIDDENDNSDNEKNKFDEAMLNLCKEIFRWNFMDKLRSLGYAAKQSDDSESWRSYGKNIMEMKGKAFSDFISNSAQKYFDSLKEEKSQDQKEIKKVFEDSIRVYFKILDLLKFFNDNNVKAIMSSDDKNEELDWNEVEILNKLCGNAVNKESLQIMAIFEFWLKYEDGLRKDNISSELLELYKYWKRYVICLTEKTDIAQTEQYCNILGYFRYLLESLSTDSKKEDLLALISSIDWKSMVSRINGDRDNKSYKFRFEREYQKANLMLDAAWDKEISTVINHYKGKAPFNYGDIEFIIDAASSEGGDGKTVIDINKFKKVFAILKIMCEDDSTLIKNDYFILLEKALLASCGDEICLLKPISSLYSYSFWAENSQNLKFFEYINLGNKCEKEMAYNLCCEIFKDLTDKIAEKDINENSIKNELNNYINSKIIENDPIDEWKSLFINNDLIMDPNIKVKCVKEDKEDLFEFSYLFDLAKYDSPSVKEKYNILYDNRLRRRFGVEMKSYLLAYTLIKEESDIFEHIVYHAQKKDEPYIQTETTYNFPSRYFAVLNKNKEEIYHIGYMDGKFHIYDPATNNVEVFEDGTFVKAKERIIIDYKK